MGYFMYPRVLTGMKALGLCLLATVLLFSFSSFKGQTVGLSGTKAETAAAATDDWPMFHHDVQHSGYSTSTAPSTNQTLWNYTTGGWVFSSPAVADGKVYVGSNNANVYCLSATTGAFMWSYTTGGRVYSSPAVAGGAVYVAGSDDHNLYAFGGLFTPTFTLTANTTSAITGGFFKLTGLFSISKTSPPNVTLQWAKDDSGFVYQQTDQTITNGTYDRDIAFTDPGTYQFRVVWPGDTTSNSAISNNVTVTVTQPIPTLAPTPTPTPTPIIPEFPIAIVLLVLVGFTTLSVILAENELARKAHN